MPDKRLIGPIEIGLIAGIVIFIIGGVAYAGLSGIITIPGVPALLADKNIASPPVASPTTDTVTTPSPEASEIATPTSTESPTATSPSPDLATLQAQRDEQRSKDLALLMQYVKEYAKANKGTYPDSSAFRTSWTDDPASPLVKALVPKYTEKLPTDPLLETEKRRYGYKRTDGDCEITASLENTKNPAAQLSTDPEGKQVYLITLKCSGF